VHEYYLKFQTYIKRNPQYPSKCVQTYRYINQSALMANQHSY